MSAQKNVLQRGLSDEDLEELFSWLDRVPLSRKKKNLSRDFSDGILVAEIVKFYFPRMVELHNYSAVNSRSQKITNWKTLNRKVLPKLQSCIAPEMMDKMVDCIPGVIEVFLFDLWRKIEYRSLQMKTRNEIKPNSNNSNNNKRVDNFGDRRLSTNSNNSANTKTSTHTANEVENYTIKNPIPLESLDLSPLDIQTRLILEEKEQALLASQETVQILQVKIRRLEHLLKLKDLRISDFEAHSPMAPSPRHIDITSADRGKA